MNTVRAKAKRVQLKKGERGNKKMGKEKEIKNKE